MSSRNFATMNVVLALLLTLTSGVAHAAATPLKFMFTMPAGIDPDKKIFFDFNGDSDTFTGNDLLAGAPGVEFHSTAGSGFLGNQVVVTLESPVPDCLAPLTAEVDSIIDNGEFPLITIPWLDVTPTPFPISLMAQPGSVLIGQTITGNLGTGEAYGIFELDSLSINLLLNLDPDCLNEFRDLQFRATAFGFSVPEPGMVASLCAGGVLGGALLSRRRRAGA